MAELRSFKNMRYASQPRLVDHLDKHLHVVTKDNSKFVVFTDSIYQNSPFTCPVSFSTEFTDREVLCSIEVESWLIGLTGYRLVQRWEI